MGIRVSRKQRENDKFEKIAVFLKNDSPVLKVDFPRNKKSVKSTFHKCVLNVSAVTNPTPMSKFGKYIVKTEIMRFSLKLIFIRISELAIC